MSELYQLPNGWEWKKLSEVFTIERGGSPRPIQDYITNDEDGINWIKIGDTEKGEKYITKTEQKIKPSGLMKSRLVIEGDFIVSNSMSFGRPYILKIKGAIHDGWLLLRGKTDDIDKGFFYYLLSSNYVYQQFSLKASGTTVKNLNTDLVKSTNVPFPPLAEQKRIVQKLDALFERIDKVIALLQKNIDATDNFMNSVLNDVFSDLEQNYPKKSLYEVVRIIGGGTPSKEMKEYWNGGDIKWATVGDMNTETIVDTELMITNSGLNNSSSNIVSKHGIVIATRVGLGKVCYLYQDTAINQDLKGLIPLDVNLLNIRYLYNYFKYMKDYIISNGTGATVKGVKLDFIKSLKLPLPDSLLQQKAVIYLDSVSAKIEQVKSAQQQEIQNLLELKSSILDQAFRGKL